MSVSKWKWTEQCEGRPCPGDCDRCNYEPAICYKTQRPVGGTCPDGREICDETCDEYFVAYTG